MFRIRRLCLKVFYLTKLLSFCRLMLRPGYLNFPSNILLQVYLILLAESNKSRFCGVQAGLWVGLVGCEMAWLLGLRCYGCVTQVTKKIPNI